MLQYTCEKVTNKQNKTKLEEGRGEDNAYGTQFSSLTDWVVVGTWRTIQQRSSSSHFYKRPF